MKCFSLFFSLLFVALLSLSVKAQWVLQHVSGLPNSTNSTLIFSPVDANIVWGVQSTDGGILNPKFVLTTDGGVS
jgi:hypothetical protein